MSDWMDVYRVQERKGWHRRKWQVEWSLCSFAQRGYTRRGAILMARIRGASPRFNSAYVRTRVLIRRHITNRSWYASRYDAFGRSRCGRP